MAKTRLLICHLQASSFAHTTTYEAARIRVFLEKTWSCCATPLRRNVFNKIFGLLKISITCNEDQKLSGPSLEARTRNSYIATDQRHNKPRKICIVIDLYTLQTNVGICNCKYWRARGSRGFLSARNFVVSNHSTKTLDALCLHTVPTFPDMMESVTVIEESNETIPNSTEALSTMDVSDTLAIEPVRADTALQVFVWNRFCSIFVPSSNRVLPILST